MHIQLRAKAASTKSTSPKQSAFVCNPNSSQKTVFVVQNFPRSDPSNDSLRMKAAGYPLPRSGGMVGTVLVLPCIISILDSTKQYVAWSGDQAGVGPG